MKLTKADKAVLDAFGDKRSASSKHLTSDGTQLDGNWMGGRGIAKWHRGGYIVERDLGSKAAQTVQRALRKMTPPNYYKPPKRASSATAERNQKAREQIAREEKRLAKLRSKS